MKAKIYVNRHVVKQNKAKGENQSAIAIRTYRGVQYTKEIKFSDGTKLVQDFDNPICSGAAIWLETDYSNISFSPES